MEPELIDEFVRMGVPRAQLPAAAPGLAAPQGPEVAEHLEGAVRLAMALRTQKRAVAGMGGVLYLGLDYARLDQTARDLRLRGGRRQRELLFKHFKVCEDEMLRVWNAPLVARANQGAAA
jgi:hypothetical protein